MKSDKTNKALIGVDYQLRGIQKTIIDSLVDIDLYEEFEESNNGCSASTFIEVGGMRYKITIDTVGEVEH